MQDQHWLIHVRMTPIDTYMRCSRNDMALNHLPDDVAGPDKRRPGRIRADGSLECDLGTVLDVSESGMRLCTSSKNAPSAGTKVLLNLRTEEETLQCPVEVRWVRRSGFFARQVGMKFLDVSPAFKVKLRKLVSSCMDMRTISAADEGMRKSA